MKKGIFPLTSTADWCRRREREYTAFLLGQKHFNYQLRGQQSHKTNQLSHSIRLKAIRRGDSISQGTKFMLKQVQREGGAQAQLEGLVRIKALLRLQLK